jgi:hypothetical protein
MASRFANDGAQRSLRRISGDIAIDQVDMKDFLNIAKAHMAAGNAGDAVTVLTALGRLDERTDVREDVKRQNAEDRKVLLAELDARGLASKEEETEAPSNIKAQLSDIGTGIKMLCDRIEALEGK